MGDSSRGLIVFLLIALLAACTRADTGSDGSGGITPNAAWWNRLSEDSQIAAVESAYDAYEIGFEDGKDSILRKTGQSTNPAYKGADFSKQLHWYIDAINNFYKRYPNGQGATIGLIMGCLSDRPLYSCTDAAKAMPGSK
jgi:hypothetical protein